MKCEWCHKVLGCGVCMGPHHGVTLPRLVARGTLRLPVDIRGLSNSALEPLPPWEPPVYRPVNWDRRAS